MKRDSQSQVKKKEEDSMEQRSQGSEIGSTRGNSLSSNSTGAWERAYRRSQSKTERPRGVNPFAGRSLYDLTIDKPTYLLLESASGYALILSHGLDKLGEDYVSTEKYISHFDQVYQLVAYHTFETPEYALNQCKSISEGIVTKELMTFLIDNLPKVLYVDGLPSCVLAVADPCMQDQIVRETKVGCASGILYNDIIRGIRFNISNIIEEWKPEVLREAQQKLARLYNRQQKVSKEGRGRPRK